MTRGRVVIVAAVGAVLVLLTAACSTPAAPPERGLAKVFSVGDCVAIPSDSPDAPTTLTADKASCAADPSYTVGAMADESGVCPSAEYQHVPTQFADPSTTRLCLVPNLVANHCYVMDMPIGMLELADCAERGQKGLLVQVTQRLDVRDQQACPAAVGHYAWPYPSPPRTYCTLTIF
ncbi:hypothetical protein H7K45_17825 [Mycobacterium yunnanensis]|uniref:Uncharacterized protein n=1 Tax=Mycobacterium yunnanensis TaxID=368477 RepID=A0A9X2Z4I4_9MYCO|nr:hypothetical protein [Mycobacterium yunnanensis]MCV7422409.1 hypothetical protein [Mycobacterium yunnanensis]